MPRFILINREHGGVFGDTADADWSAPEPGMPLTDLVRLVQGPICDAYPFRYREVSRDDPLADYDVYRAASRLSEAGGGGRGGARVHLRHDAGGYPSDVLLLR